MSSESDFEEARRRIKIWQVGEELNFNGLHDLDQLPEEISELTALRALVISGDPKRWERMPVNDLSLLSGLDKLKKLNCSYTNVKDLSSLSDLSLLSELDCSFTDVKDLSPLNGLSLLSELDCGFTDVKDLSPLSDLLSLSSLDCSNTPVADLSPLSGLSLLSKLDCNETLVEDLSPLISLSSLSELYCVYTPVTDLSPLIGLSSLSKLDCSETQVRDLNPLSGLSSLSSLDCCNTPVADLSPLIGLSSLSRLHIVGTQVTDLSPLSGLSSLSSLDCDNTSVTDLSPLIGLPSLSSLDCCNTPVADLSPLIGLSSLSKLDCSETQVTDLSPLSSLTSLERLNVYDLKIALDCSPHVIPLAELFSLNNLVVNNLLVAPTGISSHHRFDNALPRIHRWQQDLTNSGTAQEKVIKVLILGNGRIGKTQLRRRLCDHAYDPCIVSTHGIEIEDAVEHFKDEAGQEVHFKFWDFGGQDIYLSTHSMFLDNQSICVIAWHPDFENGDEEIIENSIVMRNRPLNYWLEYVRNFIGVNTPIIVVQTQCEKQSDRRDAPVFNDHGFTWFERVHSSAQRDNGINVLRGYLEDAANALLEQHGKVLLPKSWVAISSKLKNIRDKKVLPLQVFEVMCEECADIRVTPTILEYFHRNGEIFWQKNAFNNQIVLDFSWCFDGIYALFDRRRIYPVLLAQQGQFNLELLGQTVWAKYSAKEQRIFISIMEQCDICFRLTKDIYLAPQALPSFDKLVGGREQIWQESNAEIKLELYFPFLSDGVVQSMLAKLGRFARENACYWAYGCCFYDNETKAKALINTVLPEVGGKNMQGSIFIETADGNSEGLAEYLLESFLKLNPIKPPEIIWHTHLTEEMISERYSKQVGNQKEQSLRPFEKIKAVLPEGVNGPITINYIENVNAKDVELDMTSGDKNTVSVGGDMVASTVGSDNTLTASHFTVAKNQQEKETQIQNIQSLIKLLEENGELDEDKKKTSIRHFENAKEELTQSEPDVKEVEKYLNKASVFMDVVAKGSELSHKAANLLNNLGFSF